MPGWLLSLLAVLRMSAGFSDARRVEEANERNITRTMEEAVPVLEGAIGRGSAENIQAQAGFGSFMLGGQQFGPQQVAPVASAAPSGSAITPQQVGIVQRDFPDFAAPGGKFVARSPTGALPAGPPLPGGGEFLGAATPPFDPLSRASEGAVIGKGRVSGPSGLPDVSQLFTSADAFGEALPPGIMDPINFDQAGFQSTLAGQVGGLRDRGIDFSTLLSQSNLEGIVDRAESRFPDFDAFRAKRLGGIADAAREGIRQIRMEESVRPGGLAENDATRMMREFTANIGSARLAGDVEAEVEAGRRGQASFLGELDLRASGLRGGLAEVASRDVLQRDLLGTQLETRGGEFASTLQAQIDQFNKAFPVDVAARGAGFLSSDQANAANFGQFMMTGNLQAALQAAGMDAQMSAMIANMIAGIQESIPQYAPIFGGALDDMLRLFPPNQGGGGNDAVAGLELGPFSYQQSV